MIFPHSPILKMTQLAKGDQHSKSLLANVLGHDDDYISYPQHQEISIPPYKFSYSLQQTADLTNGNTYTRAPISPYPEDMSYSMKNSIPVPDFQTGLGDVIYRRHSQMSTGVIDNELSAIPGLHTNLSNAGLTSRDIKCKCCIPKQPGGIENKLEDDNKELKAILQEVCVITDKFRDEVFLAKYISRKVELSITY